MKTKTASLQKGPNNHLWSIIYSLFWLHSSDRHTYTVYEIGLDAAKEQIWLRKVNVIHNLLIKSILSKTFYHVKKMKKTKWGMCCKNMSFKIFVIGPFHFLSAPPMESSRIFCRFWAQLCTLHRLYGILGVNPREGMVGTPTNPSCGITTAEILKYVFLRHTSHFTQISFKISWYLIHVKKACSKKHMKRALFNSCHIEKLMDRKHPSDCYLKLLRLMLKWQVYRDLMVRNSLQPC